MLVDLGAVEQRYRAVLEVLDGATVTDVARRYGVARQSVHRWLRRYGGEGGIANLVDRSSRPGRCPHQMPPVVEARVLALRREHPAWGPARIGHELARQGTARLPGRSSIYRALVRHHLVDSTKRKGVQNAAGPCVVWRLLGWSVAAPARLAGRFGPVVCRGLAARR